MSGRLVPGDTDNPRIYDCELTNRQTDTVITILSFPIGTGVMTPFTPRTIFVSFHSLLLQQSQAVAIHTELVDSKATKHRQLQARRVVGAPSCAAHSSVNGSLSRELCARSPNAREDYLSTRNVAGDISPTTDGK